jgi:hypothetical protein
MESNWIAEVTESSALFDNVAVIQEHEGQLGFHTTAPSKIRNDDLLREKISFNAVLFLDELISANIDPSRCGDAVKGILIDQLAGMCEYVKHNPNGTSTRCITSIYNELFQRIKGKKDDLQRALSMLIWVATLVISEDHRLAIDYRSLKNLRKNRYTEAARAARVFVGGVQPKRHVKQVNDLALPNRATGHRRAAEMMDDDGDGNPRGGKRQHQ